MFSPSTFSSVSIQVTFLCLIFAMLYSFLSYDAAKSISVWYFLTANVCECDSVSSCGKNMSL
jgi:hypothetical protein